MIKHVRLLLLASLMLATQAVAQENAKGPKHYAVTDDRALAVTRDVLVQQGYEVTRVDRRGPDVVVWYRRGNMGKGKGKGRLVKMVLHRERDRVVFLETPSAILVAIDVKLKL